MGRVAAWRTKELGWVCANPDWRDAGSYGLKPNAPLHHWAWEFLRRNSRYRRSAAEGDPHSAGLWGLTSLANPEASSEEVRWLAIQAYQLIQGTGRLPDLAQWQVALIFDVRHKLPLAVLQRQLGELAEYLYTAGGPSSAAVEMKNRRGGPKHDKASLLLCLRFADAVANDRTIDSNELAEALGIEGRRSKRLSEIHQRASALVANDYLRLVDQSLAPMRHTPRLLKIGTQPSW
ncbi:transcriptional regulator domain-containing protein [Caenimonas sedimenti]|uniref:transcriptional regulator domain-containing protein n=1 Tax=Caenimonas sedimenti TaxID=2596921 RepID=UPI001C971E65